MGSSQASEPRAPPAVRREGGRQAGNLKSELALALDGGDSSKTGGDRTRQSEKPLLMVATDWEHGGVTRGGWSPQEWGT